MQAACGVAQLDKLPGFIQKRRENFIYLKQRLAGTTEFLQLPEATIGSDPSWFGFPITLRSGMGFRRTDLIAYLDQNRIGTRLLFAGNLVRQPYMLGQAFRTHGSLAVADKIMADTLWVGVYPGLGCKELDFVAETLESFFGVNF